MATDPVPAIEALLKDRLDPRAVSLWITAYLGKRPEREKRLALQTLQREFQARQATSPRPAGLVLGVIAKLLGEVK